MFKAQLTDGEQIECEDYEVGDNGITLFDADNSFLAFVPYAHLLYVGRVDENGRTLW
ncbi:hypothetical protein [Halomicrococcus sp. NG-SE-24]|uniref:hypothetical protein n=1 Tax=unclassified Halomicrococcus TaxID=2614448 RepID=UPI003D960738